MNTFRETPAFEIIRFGKRSLAFVLSIALLSTTVPLTVSAQDQPAQDQQDASAAPPATAQAPAYAQQTPEQLQRLVAPIALYPDSLVAQILAASTFPDEVVEADRWVQANPNLKGEELGKDVDQQPWDPSVKALSAFPSVLGNMDKNLSWTSSLGDAYYNQQQDVMDAVQVMRHKAEAAGNLKSTPQLAVKEDGPVVDIEPADPDVVYVPAYDPWLIYGYPIVAWPGWYPYPGIWFGGPFLSFGIGFGIGWWGGFGWGWGHWGFNWHGGYPLYGGARYYSQSRTFYNRNNFYRSGPGGPGRGGSERGGAERGGVFNHPGGTAKPFEGDRQAARGYAAPRGQSGTRSGAFSGYDHGGEARSYSSRGQSSFGGGGGFHGGGGGGGHAGGGGRR